MMSILFALSVCCACSFVVSANDNAGSDMDPSILPIEHASVLFSFVNSEANVSVYADPVDMKQRGLFNGLPGADVIVITHSHPDHLQPSTVLRLLKNSTKIVAPSDVQAILVQAGVPSAQITELHNYQFAVFNVQGIKYTHMYHVDVFFADGDASFNITAVPMYNTGPVPMHPKGKWNGYVISALEKLIYLSGDTNYISDFDSNFGFSLRFSHTFLCMNLPYTMSVGEAANATVAFRPQKVTPYHYRNQDNSLSNLTEYKTLVNEKAPNVEVEIMNFYPDGP